MADAPRVLVTGASTGIGRAVTLLMLEEGWTVFASVRSAGEAPAAARELVFDVTDGDAIGRATARVDELDAVVLNAGIGIAGPLEFLPPDDVARQLDVNVIGQLRVLQALLPALRRSNGRIVLMGSVGGKSALPFLGAYAMSKFALEAMADALRVELAPFGMQVSLIEPGTIATAIWTKPQRAIEEFPPAAAELYGERVEKFRTLATERAATRAESADAVAAAVLHALTCEKPKTRYLVGADAKRRARIEKLPDRLRDRVLTRFLFGS
jgi:NAD(P)-dependent dehydrogenase (short-subunit alcohol dehydrogenase family)